ncbi:MAG: hypothetical protein QXU32_02505 [Nitrososphaerales archaeon]
MDARIKNLQSWWIKTATNDFEYMLPKVSEYGGSGQGSADLRIMGDNLAALMGWEREHIDESTLQELAIWFYVQGKIGRLISDYQQRRPGKADTWHDITVYSMMARRLQETGEWP